MGILVDKNILFYALRYIIYNDKNRIDEIIRGINTNIYKLGENDVEMMYQELEEGGMGDLGKLIRKDLAHTNESDTHDIIYYVGESILYDALRYSVGRMTYAPSVVKENILYNINELSENFINNVKDHIVNCSNYGMSYDEDGWKEFLKII